MQKSQHVKFVSKDAMCYMLFKPWEGEKELVHCFTTRFGGVSKGSLESLNLGFNRGDVYENVIQNYKNVCDALEVPFESLVLSKQVHETEIIKVTRADVGNGIITPNKWESLDGFYTDEKNLTLVTHYADCVPLFFYAPEYGMIGMAHSGWRGTAQQIGAKMVKLWHEKEGIPLEAIQAAIGPSIGPCCFEVGVEVKDAFEEAFEEADFIKQTSEEKYHIDLWQCNEEILLKAGLSANNIIRADICTCCHEKLFFSHRKTKGERGTLGAFMCLKA